MRRETERPVAERLAGAIAGELAGNVPRIRAAARFEGAGRPRPPRPAFPTEPGERSLPSWSGRDPATMAGEALERIAARDGELNAVWTLADDVRGLPGGPLEGVPFLVKDIIDTAGLRTTAGTRWRDDHVPRADAPSVAALKAAGAILIGKSATFELACGGEFTPFGLTRNPHDPARTSGGSSAGSAAAVAAGYVPFALGSDTSGSIRIPAGYCGVVGFKPTRGAVPTEGVFPLAPSLDVVGPLASCSVDAAVVASVLSGRDWTVPARSCFARDTRVGLLGGVLADVLDPATAAGVSRAAAAFRSLGALVEDVDWADAWRCGPIAYAITMAEAAEVHRATPLEETGDGAASRILIGRGLDPADVAAARRAAELLRDSALDLFADHDVLMSAGAVSPAPAFDDLNAPVAGVPRTWLDVTARTMAPWSLLGFPVLSLPTGRTAGGLPVAVQLVCAPGRDAQLLTLAHELEQALNPLTTPLSYAGSHAEVG